MTEITFQARLRQREAVGEAVVSDFYLDGCVTGLHEGDGRGLGDPTQAGVTVEEGQVHPGATIVREGDILVNRGAVT